MLTTPSPKESSGSWLSSYFSKLNPVPGFPEYTGPYKVGSVDVEVPITDLESPSATPEGAYDIPTVHFRIFYPATVDSKEDRVSWLPSPQRYHVTAYTKFMGVGAGLAEVLS